MRKIISGAAILTNPQVPRYERQDQGTALRTPRAQGVGPEAFGAGLAQGIGAVSRDMQRAVAEERSRADRTAVLTGRAALDTKEQELTWGTDEKPGFLRKGGKEVFDIDAPTLQDFDAFVAQQEGQLQEGEQREVFRSLAQQRRGALDLNLQRHIHGETKKYTKAANEAVLASTANNVAQFWNDPDRVEQELRFGFGVIESDPENTSLPRAVVDQRKQAWESGIHRTVIEKMMVENPTQAQGYLTNNRDGILPDDAEKIEKQLKPLAEAQQGSETATRIFTENPKSSLLEMLAQAKAAHPNSPAVVKAAQAEIRSSYVAREEAEREAINDAENAIYSTIAKIKLNGGVPRRGDVSREDWARLATLDAKAVDRIADEIARGQEHATTKARVASDRADSKPTNEQLTTWGALKTNPAMLKKTNLDALLTQGKLGQPQYKNLIEDQQALLNDKGQKEFQLLTNKAAADIVLKGAGISQAKQPERYAKFYEALSARLNGLEKPNQEQVTAAARGLLSEVVQDEGFWSFEKTVAAFEADPQFIEVPKEARAEIEAALLAGGVPVTDDDVRDLYLEGLKRGGK